MMNPQRKQATLLVLFLTSWGLTSRATADAPKVDFARDIEPIFKKSCLSCHGLKKQEGGFALHVKEKALAGGDNGPALVAGKSAESRLYRYVAGLDKETVMPPEEAGKRLSPEQVSLIKAWIDQGATWPESGQVKAVASDHWAFKKPVRIEPPAVKNTAWPRTEIDRFILARLEKEGIAPSPEADKVTLIRRLSLDLTGLPPTIAETDAFLADTSKDAYTMLVDRLLASPHYGERWGRHWLDHARYADTNGYEKDRDRPIWPYRDWVIKAFNDDMPFDQFTIEQIAGDLLPNASVAQRTATGFHRNTMTNEEGGIDIEEFRFISLVDRVATTGTVWLGLTIQCAQCHTHKYDPITQREYYRFLAFFNNADEPELDIPDPKLTEQREAIAAKVAALEADLPNQFPATDESEGWEVLSPTRAETSSGSTLTKRPDGSLAAGGSVPAMDTYTVVIETKLKEIDAFRLEALTDKAYPNSGPGRAPNGNFVVNELNVTATPLSGDAKAVPVEFASASADVSQSGFDVRGAIDGNAESGWAIDDGSGHINKNRAANFTTKQKIGFNEGTRLTFTIVQTHGGSHTLGRFRLSARRELARPNSAPLTVAEQRARHLAEKMAAWEASVHPIHWTVLTPTKLHSLKHATLTVLPDRSVLASGDKPNNDVYEVEVPTDLKGITAVRLEVLPHESLPDGGPGRAPLFSVGDFILTELNLKETQGSSPPRPVAFGTATADFAEKGRSAQQATDGSSDTGWTVKGGIGRPHAAVFELKGNVGQGPGTKLHLTLHQEFIHQMTIGRFRVSVTTDKPPVAASGLPADVEELRLIPPGKRTVDQAKRITQYYLSIAPELARQHKQIAAVRQSMPKYPVTMVMQEREPAHARTTHVHKRGEFLKLAEAVEPGVPSILHPLPESGPRNRLTLARWLVDRENPLVARVEMNRVWQAYFGRGLVGTTEDFGTQGARPTHPELLDWLATEFPRRGWSLKAMHRLVVHSATYRQRSTATPEQLARDPRNDLLGRGPRFRVEAEVVRDIALTASGLLNRTIGGPSVYPPQPDGATALAYGQTSWPTSTGPDRYRRGLYTFLKRTSPYAAFAVMDAPTSETACVRRERSDTPLQALTLLNDAVFVEAAQALARRVLKECTGSAEDRARLAFRLCLTRTPRPEELKSLVAFHHHQLARFQAGKLDAAPIAGIDAKNPPTGVDVNDLAAWTTVARALLNLDETVTKE